MDRRVSVHLARGGLQYPRPRPLREPEHVDRPVHARLRGLHRIVLIVRRARRAREVEYAVDLGVVRERDVVPHELEIRRADQVRDVPFLAGKEIIEADDVVFVLDEPVAEMASEKTRPAGHQRAFVQRVILLLSVHSFAYLPSSVPYRSRFEKRFPPDAPSALPLTGKFRRRIINIYRNYR